MKPRFRFAWVMAAAAASLTACNADDLLDVSSPTTITEDKFWTQEQDAVLFLNGTYSALPDWRYVIELDALTDNGTINRQYNEQYVFADGTFDPGKPYSTRRWNEFYAGVARANMLLARIDQIPAARIDAARKTRYTAEAKFLRGFFYLQLAALFGDVPMPLVPVSDAEARQFTRTPVKQVYDQIIKDFDEAAAALPNSYTGADVGRVTKGAALALKARAALWDGRWQVAADAAKAVMDLGVYSLSNNYPNLFLYAGENSSEHIFVRKYSKTAQASGQNNGIFGAYGPPGNSSASEAVPIRDLVDHYQTTNGQPIGAGNPQYNPAWNLMYQNRDPRLGYTILHPTASWDGITFDSRPVPLSSRPEAISLQDENRSVTGYNIRKWIDLTDKADRGNGGIDIIYMRYADVLLMFAEAKVQLGQGGDPAAVAALNAVRQRPTVNMPAVTGPLTMPHIMYERRAEFAFEGTRLFDIRRWKIAETVMPASGSPLVRGIDYVNAGGTQVTHTVPASARSFPLRNYLWPIPQAEIDKNKNLTQNPGF